MNKQTMYDTFSLDYDRFVNWKARLPVEIPFLTSELASLSQGEGIPVSVLDVACGTGQHVIALTEAGFTCAGADFSAAMIAIARQNAAQRNLDIVFKHAGFGELEEAFGNVKFDGLVCLGNSLPHVLDERRLAETLADFRAVMRSGGKLVIQNRNFYPVLKERLRWMPPQTYREKNKTYLFARFYDFDPDGRITFNIQRFISEGTGSFDQQIISTRLWPLSQNQLAQALRTAGFGHLNYYGDLQGAAFDEVL